MRSDLATSRKRFERGLSLLRSSLDRELGRWPPSGRAWTIPTLALLAGIAVGLGSGRTHRS